MRTFRLPNVIRSGLMVGPLALIAAVPATAAEPASSVNFVNRDALTATTTNGWRNPLRANSPDAVEDSGNSLRQEVSQVSYEEEVGVSSRSPNGLQTRPHNEATGIFSGLAGESKNAFTKPRVPNRPADQPQFRKAATAPETAKSATAAALNMLPKFESSAARQQSAQEAAKAQAEMTARAGSARPRPTPAANGRPATSTATQASYNTAASAESYRHNSAPTSTASAARRQMPASAMPANATPRPVPSPWQQSNAAPLARPTLDTSRPTVRPVQSAPSARIAAQPTSQTNSQPKVDPSSPAGILTQAHELAASARSEDDFSKIFAMCQQVPARSATAEETTFGRELAAWSLNRRGQLRAKSGNRDAAMADFEQAVHIDGKCWRAIHNRGVLLAQAGQFEPAFDDFHQTIELNPGFAKAYANRAALYVLAGELEPALADYEQAIGLDPNFAVAERGCGRTCHMLGRMDEAMEHLTRAIELAPRDAAAVASRGDLLTDMGHYEAAASDYDHALKINPKFSDAYRGSAWLLATCPDGAVRNPGVALERAKRAISLERKADATTIDTLAAAQASVGDFKAATQTIQRAIELAPPSERSVYQDRMQMYQHARPYRIEPVAAVEQTGFEQ